MPRKQSAGSSADLVVEGNESYLDNFLNGVIEEANLPGELKRYLGQLRELDTQSQELFERMQRLSKNHIAKAKRSVQDGREPDEEYLAKARRTYKELVEIDEEKVSLADQMHAEVAKHYAHCSSELRKFEEELKEKGQLKTPQMKTQLSRQESTSHDADGGGAGSSSGAAADAAGPGGRRGRQGAAGVPEQPTSANSHKRGRGRKVSFKEAERQRAVAEAMAEERAPPPPSNAPAFNYNDAELPIATREESNNPLCGAVPASPDYIIPDGAKVCAKPPNNKMQPQDWILATVLRYTPATAKYTILDEDEADADPWAQGDPSSARQHVVSRRMVLPLPLTEPSVYTQYNEFPRGQWVLALYPDTTCFYKALVHTPPSEMSDGPTKAYLVEFEDESEASGKSEPMRVPTKYVMRMG
mmetsp:Transcript_44342/g.116511  ORF Transcript_44342/g.116511 Transcript_44342/m.116511 type:complete len:414 (+) Transcript_44342:18-1259(+)